MAKKPKLSKNQQRKIAQNRRKRLNSKISTDKNEQDPNLGDAIDGRVISRFGKQAIVEASDKDRQQFKCHIRRTIKSVVCGDEVIFRPNTSDDDRNLGVIEIVKDRRSVLSRPDYYDGVKPIAANIDQIVVVSAIVPSLSTHIIDRYLVACEQAEIDVLLVINKMELLDQEDRDYVQDLLQVYTEIGYKVCYTSCKIDNGLEGLAEHLKDKVNVLVGQSGVGKSSLINQLLPESDEAVGDVSQNSGLGQHTTTAAKLLAFAQGGELIDSPGVREFGLWHLPIDDITSGFIEFREYIGACKFSDCKHKNDPGCVIREAVENEQISHDRYQSYLKIIDSLDQNKPSYIKQ